MNTVKAEHYLRDKILAALQTAFHHTCEVIIEKPRQETFGDFATSAALGLARELKMPPRGLADKIVQHLDDSEGMLAKVSVDGPGFINFTLSAHYWHTVLEAIIAAGADFGRDTWGNGEKRQIEFVSANPTGPLNVVSARAAAVGDVLATLFSLVGYDCQREYYVNDAGRQIRLLGASVSARYMALCGRDEPMPEEGYQGDYIIDLASEIKSENGETFVALAIDKRHEQLAQIALNKMLALHQQAMQSYRVQYDRWYRESKLRAASAHHAILNLLAEKGQTYKKDGAVWFKSAAFGDAKDRVLVTSDGEPTYFLVDIAYHHDKYQRGFVRIFDLWGPDHHGYIARMTAALEALGHPRENFQVGIIQQVNMLRGGEVVKMSKRAGNIIEMTEIVDEVGVDAARFFFLMRKLDSPLDFDIDLAKKQTDENPVFYVQYAHARLANIFEYARSQGVEKPQRADLSLLTADEELSLIKKLAEYPDVIGKSAQFLEPHRLTTYLMEMAGSFHSFYHKHRVITEDAALSKARLMLVEGTRVVLKNALDVLKISAPERM